MPIIKEDPFTKYDPTNFGKVKGEVTTAMKDDWKRDKVDDAKKRAITTAHTYDDFKSRVAGCTLKPIHRSEFNAPPKFAFNRQLNGGLVPPPGGAPDAATSSGAVVSVGARLAPSATAEGGVGRLRSSRELEREFGRCSSVEEKVALLGQLDGDACAKFFAKEVDAEFLRHMLLAFDEAASAGVGPPGAARSMLACLAQRCPTSLQTAATFLMAPDRAMAARLLARVEVAEAGEDVRICAALGMPPSSVAAAAAALQEAASVATEQAAASDGAAGGPTGASASVADGMD